MNKNIDLTKILKDCPKGWEFYSDICGKVIFNYIDNNYSQIIVVFNNYITIRFTKEGYCCTDDIGEKCMLFPSKDQRDWSKFTAPWYKKEELIKPKFKVGDIIRHKETNKDYVYEINKVYNNSYGLIGFNWGICIKDQDQYELVPNKFDPKTLKPFDKVLRRDYLENEWECDIFFYIRNEKSVIPYRCVGGMFKYCIPYNDDTKHLVGTKEEAPEYYRYWED